MFALRLTISLTLKQSGHRRPYDLLATTGDYLRLWDLKDEPEQDTGSNTIGRRPILRQQLAQRCVLANVRSLINLSSQSLLNF